MDYYRLFTQALINKFSIEHRLMKEQITEFIAEVKAYDTDGDGTTLQMYTSIL